MRHAMALLVYYFFLCVYLEAFSANLWRIDASVNVVDREVTLAHNNLLMLAV